MNKELIKTLKELQINANYPAYKKPVEFPRLPPLSLAECECILKQISHGKAIALDLVSDFFLGDSFIKKSAAVFRDLWSCQIVKARMFKRHFYTRVTPLNKVAPAIPSRTEFRPIVIMSVIVKILEARLLPKLQSYLKNKMIISQTGFVPGCSTSMNVIRAIRRIKLRTEAGKNVSDSSWI